MSNLSRGLNTASRVLQARIASHRVPNLLAALSAAAPARHSSTAANDAMSAWQPPKKIEELYAATSGNNFSAINAPTAGAREKKELPRGDADFQLYSLSTPNGQKAGIILEELSDLGLIEYDAHVIALNGPQFYSGFVDINPNSKIPAAVDYKPKQGGKPVKLFESASIVYYLAEKYGKFLPSDPSLKTEVMNWVFFQMAGQGPMTGNFGHFFVYAPPDKHEARNYGAARYGMEVQRICDVIDKHLAGKTYMVGEEYTIADIILFPWALQVRLGYKHPSGISARDFLSFDKYSNLNAWIDRINARPAVKRGLRVCNTAGHGKPWLVDGKGKM